MFNVRIQCDLVVNCAHYVVHYVPYRERFGIQPDLRAFLQVLDGFILQWDLWKFRKKIEKGILISPETFSRHSKLDIK